MNEAAWLSELNTAGTEWPPRSRITTTTQRLPFWFRPNDGDGDILSDEPASHGRRAGFLSARTALACVTVICAWIFSRSAFCCTSRGFAPDRHIADQSERVDC